MARDLSMRVEILGVNGIADEPYNSQVTQVLNVLPWLQDTTDVVSPWRNT